MPCQVSPFKVLRPSCPISVRVLIGSQVQAEVECVSVCEHSPLECCQVCQLMSSAVSALFIMCPESHARLDLVLLQLCIIWMRIDQAGSASF